MQAERPMPVQAKFLSIKGIEEVTAFHLNESKDQSLRTKGMIPQEVRRLPNLLGSSRSEPFIEADQKDHSQLQAKFLINHFRMVALIHRQEFYKSVHPTMNIWFNYCFFLDEDLVG
jgi:hypothetical protein